MTIGRTLIALPVLMLVVYAPPVVAQYARNPLARTIVTPADVVASAATSGATAFGYEAVGGVAGSLIGFGVGYALVHDSCAAEDLSCELRSAGIALAMSAVGAAAGTYIAGRNFDTDPSALGAAIGAAAGALAGVGTWHLVTEDLDLIRSETGAAIVYGITQGIVTALGSRITRHLSNR